MALFFIAINPKRIFVFRIKTLHLPSFNLNCYDKENIQPFDQKEKK